MPRPLVAVLDACVLYPAILRDALLRAAEAGVYQLRWTEEILSELRRNLVADRGAPAERVERMLAGLAAAFEDGRVSGHERHVQGLKNDPKDRHVVATAIEGGAELIVTANLKHFPPALMPDGIRAISADEFLLELFERAPGKLVDVVWLQANQKKRPPMSVQLVVQAIGRAAPRFRRAIQPILSVRTHEQLASAADRLERALHASPVDAEEMAAALTDACLLNPEAGELLIRHERAIGPMTLRTLAQIVASGDGESCAEARATLQEYGIDPEKLDVTRLTDDEILALMDRARATSQ